LLGELVEGGLEVAPFHRRRLLLEDLDGRGEVLRVIAELRDQPPLAVEGEEEQRHHHQEQLRLEAEVVQPGVRHALRHASNQDRALKMWPQCPSRRRPWPGSASCSWTTTTTPATSSSASWLAAGPTWWRWPRRPPPSCASPSRSSTCSSWTS